MPRPIRYHCSLASLRQFDEPLAAQLERIKAAGFDGVESGLPGDRDAKQFSSLLHGLAMSLGVAAYLPENTDPEPLFERAAAAGALYVEAQVDGYWRDDEWIDDRTRQLIELGERYQVPFLLETHRGRYTQDPRRTLALLGRLPGLRLCGDFSHYTSTSELKAPWPAPWRDAMLQIATRCDIVHVRMNAGQRVQDPLCQVGSQQRAEYLHLYRHALHSGNGQVPFTVTTELLPPDYQCVDPRTGEPQGDIWADTKDLLAIVAQALDSVAPPKQRQPGTDHEGALMS
jgi:sugar phosphate isomerase/epimerase